MPVNGFLVDNAVQKYNYESLVNYNTPDFSSSSSKAYAIGDYVMYNGKLYKCTTATTGGTWDANNWAEAILTDDVTEQKNAIGQLREISILFIGNSLTQDGIAYLPYMLKTFYPDIKFKFYIYYNGGFDLAQTYQQFLNDGTCSIFSVAENVAAWTNYNSTVKMSDVLSTYTFDIVCMQEYFNEKTSYTSTTDWGNCQKYIQAHYTGGNGLEFISLFHAPKRSDVDNIFDLTKSGNLLILEQTIAQDMIPIGIAVYRALSTALDSLGDQGHLSPDGTHTQEGLPCLLQTYVSLLWIFSHLSINKSVYGLPFKMTTAIYSTLSVPGPNLGTGVIEGTDAENLLAQQVAIQAFKEGCGLVEYARAPKLRTVASISAVFTQGANNIYPFDTLDYLKQFLTVTATFADGTSGVITDYTLSGTLASGTSTVTVTAGSATESFSVTVSVDPFASATYAQKRIYRYSSSGQYGQYIAIDNNAQSNNMAITVPLANKDFLLTVTNSSAYDLLVYNVTDTTYTAGGYPGVSNGKAWVKSDYSISNYLMARFRKTDDSAFSSDEMANLYGTVFTVSRRVV